MSIKHEIIDSTVSGLQNVVFRKLKVLQAVKSSIFGNKRVQCTQILS